MKTHFSRRERRAAAASKYAKAAWYQALHNRRHSNRIITELTLHRGFDFSRDWRAL